MDISSFVESVNGSGNKSEDNTSACNENNAIHNTSDEFLLQTLTEMNEEEDDEDYEDSDNNDNEGYGEDILLALGEGYSEEQNDLPAASNQVNASPSKLHLPLLKNSQHSGIGLTGDLDILNLNTQLSKLGVPGTSDDTDTNASTCLFLNNIYQALLLENLAKVREKLAENQEKQNILAEKIKQTNRVEINKLRINVFCMPYFHRKGTRPQPNEHTKLLETWHYGKIPREKPWTMSDHEVLLEGIHENAWEMTLKPFLQRIEIYTVKQATSNDAEEKEELEKKITDTKLDMDIALDRYIDDIVMDIDDDKFDWMKISNLSLKGKHSEFSCRLMWKNWLHPRVNKSPWTQIETQKLKELVKLHGRHQWKFIAEEVGTNRTPFHCLQHYRRRLDCLGRREWTEEEDKILREVLDTCRIGNNIPWNQVSFYMEGRNAESCSKRWSNLDPELRHGRWTADEDSLLVTGMSMLGTANWKCIKQLIPSRTVDQCRDRWINCLDPRIKTDVFTYDEDKLLYKIVKENGTNWALIASMLPGRTDAHVRKQYLRLQKWESQSKYVTEQSPESKNFFLNDFDVKHFANLVEKNKPLEELLPLLPVSNQNDIGIIWRNQQQILKRDLVRQEIDLRKGEIFVPRPQLLRRYSSPTIVKIWEQRKRMQHTITNLIEQKMIKITKTSPRNRMKVVKSKRRSAIAFSPKLNQLKPNASVTEMLNIARLISNQFVPEKPVANKKSLYCNVDRKIKHLLYLDCLKEEMKDKPKLSVNKSEATCDAEKSMDRLEGMTLIINVLGMARSNILKKVLCGTNSDTMQSTRYMTAEELHNFKEEFLLISDDPKSNGNYSGNKTPKVAYCDNIPPNIHTLTAFRLLLHECKHLQKSAERYSSSQKKSNENSDEDKDEKFLPLPEKMEKVKKTYWYEMLENHFRSLFAWPVLLSTLNGVSKNLGAAQPRTQVKRKKCKYPLLAMSRKRRKVHSTDGSSNEEKEPILKPCEESNKNSGAATTATVSTAPGEPTLKKRRGRPHGSLTKNKKVFDPIPQRASSRKRVKKSQFDTESSERPNPKMTKGEVGCEASAMTKDLLANLSPNLIQQVISQEVEVKPIGTYITVPLAVKKE